MMDIHEFLKNADFGEKDKVYDFIDNDDTIICFLSKDLVFVLFHDNHGFSKMVLLKNMDGKVRYGRYVSFNMSKVKDIKLIACNESCIISDYMQDGIKKTRKIDVLFPHIAVSDFSEELDTMPKEKPSNFYDTTKNNKKSNELINIYKLEPKETDHNKEDKKDYDLEYKPSDVLASKITKISELKKKS